jgi:hypothetical protein
MHYTLNESTLTKKISRVLANGSLSSKKEVEGYGKDSKDDGNGTQDTSPHPLINVSIVRFLKKTSS